MFLIQIQEERINADSVSSYKPYPNHPDKLFIRYTSGVESLFKFNSQEERNEILRRLDLLFTDNKGISCCQ